MLRFVNCFKRIYIHTYIHRLLIGSDDKVSSTQSILLVGLLKYHNSEMSACPFPVTRPDPASQLTVRRLDSTRPADHKQITRREQQKFFRGNIPTSGRMLYPIATIFPPILLVWTIYLLISDTAQSSRLNVTYRLRQSSSVGRYDVITRTSWIVVPAPPWPVVPTRPSK